MTVQSACAQATLDGEALQEYNRELKQQVEAQASELAQAVEAGTLAKQRWDAVAAQLALETEVSVGLPPELWAQQGGVPPPQEDGDAGAAGVAARTLDPPEGPSRPQLCTDSRRFVGGGCFCSRRGQGFWEVLPGIECGVSTPGD